MNSKYFLLMLLVVFTFSNLTAQDSHPKMRRITSLPGSIAFIEVNNHQDLNKEYSAHPKLKRITSVPNFKSTCNTGESGENKSDLQNNIGLLKASPVMSFETTVYPNPSQHGSAILVKSLSPFVKVIILNKDGEPVFENSNFETNLTYNWNQKLIPGIYYLNVLDGNETKSLIIVRE